MIRGRRSFMAGALAAVVAACTSSNRAQTQPTGSGPYSTSLSTSPSSSTAAAARFVARGDGVRRQVALTFHTNGDRLLGERLLETVEAQHASITAFVVGSWLEANPDFAKRITDGGHELANHTYTHPTFPSLDPAAMGDEIVRCRDVLTRLSGSTGRYFRPSGTANGVDDPGPTVLQLAGEAGYPIVLGFDIDPSDYRDPGAEAVIAGTLDSIRAGSIVSLHFGHQGTIDALAPILAGLAQRDLQPVTVSTLLEA